MIKMVELKTYRYDHTKQDCVHVRDVEFNADHIQWIVKRNENYADMKVQGEQQLFIISLKEWEEFKNETNKPSNIQG